MNTTHRPINPLITSLLWLSIGIYIVFAVSVFLSPQTALFGKLFNNPVYDFIESIPVWLYIFINLTLFLFASSIILNSLSLYYGFQRSRNDKFTKRYFSFFIYVLSNYFSRGSYKDEENRKIFLKRIKPFLKKRIQLIAFLESYLRIQELVAEDLSKDFKLIIEELNIQRRIDSFIKSRNFDDVILILKVQSYLKIHTNIEQIEKLTKNKNFVVRTEAYAALIRLMDSDKLFIGFIEKEDNLSILDINIIANAVLKNRKDKIDYRPLLTSSKERVVMIGLLLAKWRSDNDSANTNIIHNYLGHPNVMLNILAWNALLVILPEKEAVDIIVERFEQEPDPVKLKILENSDNISDHRFYDFFTDNLEQQSLLVKVEAMKIIYKNNPTLLLQYANSPNPETEMAYNETVCTKHQPIR